MALVQPDPERSPAGTMKLVGGDPCLDFVNTVGGRIPVAYGPGTRVQDDKLGSYQDLVDFAVHRGLVPEAAAGRLARLGRARPGAARAALGRALGLREALHRTLRALMTGRRPDTGDLVLINREVAACRRHEALAARGQRLQWEWRAAALEAPLWAAARASEALLTSRELPRLRECGGGGCGWLFLDHSRNGRRRWCSMEDCGNLEKVRRFRRRHARQL